MFNDFYPFLLTLLLIVREFRFVFFLLLDVILIVVAFHRFGFPILVNASLSATPITHLLSYYLYV